MKISTYIYLFLGLALCWGCDPYEEGDIVLGPLPGPPEFSMEIVPDNPNKVVVRMLSDDFFSHTWSFPGGIPEQSFLVEDTVLYRKAGDYAISLFAAQVGGAGSSSVSKSVTIAQDALVECSDMLTLLLGGCEEDSQKCWTFSQVAGAITVGPTPGSGEWFTSNEASLDPVQYDDSFCFSFANSQFLYLNNGQTVDPWNGYQAVDYSPPSDHNWLIVPGAGANGEDQIVLPEGSFMGVWDSGPLYDIVRVTETELVVRSQIVATDGWFELYFVPQ